MTLIVTLDEKNGMMFGNRRQAKDRALCERILSLTKGKNLLVSPYSAPLFPEKEELLVLEDPSENAEADDFIFVEDTPLPGAEKYIVYRWNRRYPATRFFDKDLKKEGFTLIRKEDFAGFSHERITEEIWQK